MKRVKRIPVWLRRLDRVKAELRATGFPRTAGEGLRQCAALSAVSLRLLREEISKGRARAGEAQVETEVSRLLARFARADARWALRWRRDCARSFGR